MSDKIYWQDIRTERVVLEGSCYYADGKLVYWLGREARQAQAFLRKRAKGQHDQEADRHREEMLGI